MRRSGLRATSFDRPLMMIHGDVVLADDLAASLFSAEPESLIAFDSSVRDPKEINVAIADGRVTRFGVNFAGFSGSYAGVLKLSERAAGAFARYARSASPARVQRSADLLFLRRSNADRRLRHCASRPSISPVTAGRRSTTSRTLPPRERRWASGQAPMSDSALGSLRRQRDGSLDFAILDTGAAPGRCAGNGARDPVDPGRRRRPRSPRDRNSTCYRVSLSAGNEVSEIAVIKVPRSGPQRTNDDVTFAGETAILARLPDAGIANAYRLLARVKVGGIHFLRDHERARAHRQIRCCIRSTERRLASAFRQPVPDGSPRPDALRSQARQHSLRRDRHGFVDFEFARFEPWLDAYAPATAAYCEDYNVSPNPHFPARTNVANFEFRTLFRYLAGLEQATVRDGCREFLPRLSAGEVAISHADGEPPRGTRAR